MLRTMLGGWALLVAVDILSAQTTQPHLVMQRTSPDVPARLEWSSEPNAVYRVEHSADLINWVLAAEDIASQGTITSWTDLGSPSNLNPIKPSIDPNTPYRFYRVSVQRYTPTDSSISVTISDPLTGTTLSGADVVYASATATRVLNSARLYVDGEEVSLASGDSYELPLDTRFYANGLHRISVIAEDDADNSTTGEDAMSIDTIRSSYGAANVTVTFDNFLSNVRLLHQAFRPDLDQQQEIFGTWASPRSWRVDFTAKDDPATVYPWISGNGLSVPVSAWRRPLFCARPHKTLLRRQWAFQFSESRFVCWP